MLEERAAGEVAHQRLVDRGVLEVELVDFLGQRQIRLSRLTGRLRSD